MNKVKWFILDNLPAIFVVMMFLFGIALAGTSRSIIEKDELKKLHDKVDKLQTTVDELAQRLYKHIKFVDSTYDGLKNPIEAARRWLRK